MLLNLVAPSSEFISIYFRDYRDKTVQEEKTFFNIHINENINKNFYFSISMFIYIVPHYSFYIIIFISFLQRYI